MIIDGRVPVPSTLLAGGRAAVADHFVLRVVGDGMKEDGLRDGDFLIIQRCDRPADGEIVVAMIGDDGTIKRYYHEGDMVRLEPIDGGAEVRVAAADVCVRGLAIGLMRRFVQPGRPT